MPIPPPANAKRVFKGHIMDFWQWDQTLYDGSIETFECVTRPDTASVIPFVDAQTVLLTKQMQPHKTEPFFDFPGGRIDPGEEMPHAVARELEEETGYAASRWLEWRRLGQRGSFRYEEGLYIAKDIKQITAPRHEPGEHIEILVTPWKDVVDLCLQQKLRGSVMMLAVLQMEFDPASKKRLHDWLRG